MSEDWRLWKDLGLFFRRNDPTSFLGCVFSSSLGYLPPNTPSILDHKGHFCSCSRTQWWEWSLRLILLGLLLTTWSHWPERGLVFNLWSSATHRQPILSSWFATSQIYFSTKACIHPRCSKPWLKTIMFFLPGFVIYRCVIHFFSIPFCWLYRAGSSAIAVQIGDS